MWAKFLFIFTLILNYRTNVHISNKMHTKQVLAYNILGACTVILFVSAFCHKGMWDFFKISESLENVDYYLLLAELLVPGVAQGTDDLQDSLHQPPKGSRLEVKLYWILTISIRTKFSVFIYKKLYCSLLLITVSLLYTRYIYIMTVFNYAILQFAKSTV
jgi:hypothetical protein